MLLLVRCTLLLAALFARHDIHISYGQSELREGLLHSKITFYKDDYLKALDNWLGKPSTTLSPSLQSFYRDQYLATHFRVWVDGTAHSIGTAQFLQIEKRTEDASTIIYECHFVVPASAISLTMDNEALLQTFSGQMNLMLIKAFGKEINQVFNTSHPTVLISKTP